MRIIKEGKLPLKERKMECNNCGCLFMYEQKDIYSDQREGNYVVCPTCKKFINVYGVGYNKRNTEEKDRGGVNYVDCKRF